MAVTSLTESVEATSDVRTEATFVIRDAETLRRVWSQVFGNRTTRDVPTIDFNQQMIVIVAMGAQPSNGHGIRITGAIKRDRGVIVQVTTMSPGSGCSVVAGTTYPVAVARLRKTDATVRFDFTRTTHDCTGR